MVTFVRLREDMPAICALSDLHTDIPGNMRRLRECVGRMHDVEICIVAGDVSHRLSILRDTLALLRTRFHEVFFVPGNHELWQLEQGLDSWHKLNAVLALCADLGVHTEPRVVGDWRIIPMLTWYDDSWATSEERQDQALEGWMDRYLCRWGGCDPVQELLRRTSERAQSCAGGNARILSFSHFVPRIDLVSRQSLTFKGLPAVCGSAAIDRQVRSLGSRIHVFGHTHIPCDVMIGGIRYLHSPILSDHGGSPATILL